MVVCLAPIDLSEGASSSEEEKKKRKGAFVGGRVAQYSAPLGARLCDLLLWRKTVDELESPLPPLNAAAAASGGRGGAAGAAGAGGSGSGGGGDDEEEDEIAAALFRQALEAKKREAKASYM